MRGGAELLVENLVAALQRAGHEVEIVRVPVAWGRGQVLPSALAWRMLEIGGDMAICTNFPSYMARHVRKVVWLVHQHRGAYDAFGQPWSDFDNGPESDDVAVTLARWDSVALREAERVYTISSVVADRAKRYNGVTATMLPHPPPLAEHLHPGSFGSYILCVSRLEANKRVDLAVRGFLEAGGGGRLVIAGTGSAAEELRALAQDNRAVTFLGFVPDEDLVDLMAHCRAVIYTPHDEDYGYATLQAFMAGKPVITVDDSGGPLEWVRDGETGWVTAPTAEAVGGAIAAAFGQEERCRSLGETAALTVSSLSWLRVVETLVGP